MKHIFVLVISLVAWSCHSKQSEVLSKGQNTTTQNNTNTGYKEFSLYSNKYAWILLNNGKLMFTLDEGKSWEQIARDTSNMFVLLTFISSTTGWAVAANQDILKSDDAGKSWVKISSLPKTDHAEDFKQLVFALKK